MKKYLLTIAAVLTASLSFAQDNLLTNGGFEEGVETGWTPIAYPAAKNATVSESSEAHTGSKAALIAGNEKNVRLASTDLVLKPGTYTLTAYVKAATADGAAVRLGYVPINNGKAGSYSYSTNKNGVNNADTITTEWEQLTYTFTLEAQSTVNILVMNSKNLAKDVLVDDAALTTTDGGLGEGGGETTQGTDYTAALTDGQGSWTFENVKMADSLTYVWQQNTSYGMKASAYNKVAYEAESYLVSPALKLEAGKTSVLTFDHVQRFATDPSKELTLWVRENGSKTWAAQLTIPTYSTGADWTFVPSGEIDLSAYAGKTIQLGWRYTSTAEGAATWELKNVKVTNAAAAEKEPELQDPTNTPATAYTVAQAVEIIKKKEAYNMSKQVYVIGTIESIEDVSWDTTAEKYYGNATYNIVDDGVEGESLKVFRGYYLDNVKFNQEDMIKVGDEVIVYGKLTLYNNEYEMNTGNYLYSINGSTYNAINNIEAKQEGKAVIYDLQGRRVSKASQGIYIINGKKVLR